MSLNSGLIFKWLKSENASSAETKRIARLTYKYLNLSPKKYRKMLSYGREKIRVLERLMSQGRFDEIDFSKLPSRAGLLYRNSFKRNEATAERYAEFAKNKDTKVNAGTLYPYDVVKSAINLMGSNSWWHGSKGVSLDDTERLMINKYWENMRDYFDGASLDALVVCDTSNSMMSSVNSIAPIDIAVSLAIYASERNSGPWKNHYISFSHQAKLVEVRGVDFCDKVDRIVRANLCEDTSLESVFDLLINTIKKNNLVPSALPKSLVIVSDMEINYGCGEIYRGGSLETTMDKIRRRWYNMLGDRYSFPQIVYWNVDARQNTFLEDQKSGVSFISGASPVLFEQLIKGKTAKEIMWDKLNEPQYNEIH